MATTMRRAAAYPLVALIDDGDAMEVEAMGKAQRALGDGPLRVVTITQTAERWVQYRIEREVKKR